MATVFPKTESEATAQGYVKSPVSKEQMESEKTIIKKQSSFLDSLSSYLSTVNPFARAKKQGDVCATLDCTADHEIVIYLIDEYGDCTDRRTRPC